MIRQKYRYLREARPLGRASLKAKRCSKNGVANNYADYTVSLCMYLGETENGLAMKNSKT